MDDTRFGRHLAIYTLRPKTALSQGEVTAAVRRLADGLTEGQPHRTGNFTRFRLLYDGQEERHLLLVSADMPMSPDGRIDQLAPQFAVQAMGAYGTVALPSVTEADLAVNSDDPEAREFDLGRQFSVAEVQPLRGKGFDGLVAAVDSHLVPYLHKGPTRGGMVTSVSLLEPAGDNYQQLLILGTVDAQGGLDPRLDELADTAAITPVGFFIQLSLNDA
ncbi:hypothetical protein GCM10010441_14040 [Kitasatospora paracochleata]|uniref:Uncharacterized protein n=1 Tax=Kitasatospora paracochleata TaxID=58354 RepID=A0ABT1JAL6_9ACTN|nr:hypothetical protein [Kitasatospora paracochleata]MCP2314499.1 hypothetical protein [Kitasatospora paracochleata]